MASKWSVEAFVHTLRFELQLRKYKIDACMLNPGTIKPTQLAEVGHPTTSSDTPGMSMHSF